ncbi:aldo/keto reductase [Paludibaculum fermentans]|uniref:aldo/keto reductase n=1 Tax=Paludibaculum fermentans TaxID=1473598 RepID=UPI003EBEB582
MKESDSLSYGKLPLREGAGQMPALGFGTLLRDLTETRTATATAIGAGFRHFDCSERYRNEEQVGQAIGEAIEAGDVHRNDLFITTKLWNNNHRPERVQPAFEASLERLNLDYLDLYLIHTPYAFQPGENQDPRDANDNVIYDKGTTLIDTWLALEKLVDLGRCRAIGLSDVNVDQLREIFVQARIKPAAVQVEAHPHLPQTELVEFCQSSGVVMVAFAPLGHGIKPGVLEEPAILAIAQRVNRTPAQVLLAWAVQRGTAILTTPRTAERARENFGVSILPMDAMEEIDAIQTRQRFNLVTGTGIPGFIDKGK